MRILPGPIEFSELSIISKRVPVCGVKTVPNLSPPLLYRELFADDDDSFLFESGRGPEETSRYSFMGTSNSRSIKIQNKKACSFDEDGLEGFWMEPLEGLDRLNFDDEINSVNYLPHFWGGWVGVIGYELAGLFEKLPPRKKDGFGIPDLYMFQVDRLVVYDHKEKILKFIVSAEGPADYSALVKEIQRFWKRVEKFLTHSTSANPRPTGNQKNRNGLHSNMTRNEYVECVQRAKTYTARRISLTETPGFNSPFILETMWLTWEYCSKNMRSETRTLPVLQIRPRSLRSRSTNIKCSARSFSFSNSSAESDLSISGSLLLGRVPAMGRVSTLEFSTLTRRSGEELTITKSCNFKYPEKGEGFTDRRRRNKSNGSP